MKNRMKLAAVLALALGGAAVVFSQQGSLTGTLTDSMCGSTHMAKNKTPAECTRMCVKDGMKYALSVDKKLYTLEGHEQELAKLAGQKVTVKGSAKGDTVTVESVTPAKWQASRRTALVAGFTLQALNSFFRNDRNHDETRGRIGPPTAK